MVVLRSYISGTSVSSLKEAMKDSISDCNREGKWSFAKCGGGNSQHGSNAILNTNYAIAVLF